MSNNVNQEGAMVYRFHNFELDVVEKTLKHEEETVPLTPKAFHTLTVLLENAGHLLEKDFLMEQIWGDRFVEESNLTFNIRAIRKALGDSASKPEFVETIPRRGYRFIASVEPESPTLTAAHGSNGIGRPVRKKRNNPNQLLVAAALLVALLGVLILIAVFGYLRKESADRVPLLAGNLIFAPITATGGVRYAVVSPDGKYVVYLDTKGKNGIVWLRESDTNSNRQIIPPTDDVYAGFAISPDSRHLYFARRPRLERGQADIYQMPLFGGTPVKVISDTQGWISIAPEGKKLAFVRCFYREDDNCSLWTADAKDGLNERRLAVRQKPFRIGTIAFSPDGSEIAFANGQSNDQSDSFKLSRIELESGKESDISSENYFNVGGIAWLPSGDSLLVTAINMPDRHYFLRYLKVGGVSELVANSIRNPVTLSIDRDAKQLLATTVSSDFDLRIASIAGDGKPAALANAMNAAFGSDGRILFSSGKSGVDAIWSMGADGRDQRQLTTRKFWETKPIGGTDKNAVYFASNRSGKVHVWKMNADGSDQIQVTKNQGGFPVFVDGARKWLYFHHGVSRDLWRVSLVSGTEENVLKRSAYSFSVSGDGNKVAFIPTGANHNLVKIASLPNGEEISEFELPEKDRLVVELGWLPDGNELVFVSSDADLGRNLLSIFSIDSKVFRQIAELGDDAISESSGIGVSPDGSQVVFVQGSWKHDALLISGFNE